MPPRPPRQASQAPRAPRQASQAPKPSGAEVPDYRLDRLQDAQDIRNAAQAAQAGFPGPQAAQTGPQAALEAFSGRPSCWNGLRECSCRHCSCRQNTALWPCQTGPRPSRQAPRPPRHLALVARTTSRRAVASTWLLSTKHCSCRHCFSRQHLALFDTDNLQDCFYHHNIAPVDKTQDCCRLNMAPDLQTP